MTTLGKDNNGTAVVEADRYHRRHATCELAIRDLKDSGGLAHLPSGVFAANAAWPLCAALAHNLWSSPHVLDTWFMRPCDGSSCPPIR